MVIRESNAELAHQWLAKAAEIDGTGKDIGLAHVYATLAVADALAIVHREIAYVAETIAADPS